jgi:hypothetical protein
MGTRILPSGECGPGVKYTTHPPPSAKGKNEESYNSTSPIGHHGMDRGNLYLHYKGKYVYKILR